MGKSYIGDIDDKDNSFIDPDYKRQSLEENPFDGVSSTPVKKYHGLKVERCRYLEDAGCASICIHTCKIPTQLFFNKDMGIPLKMEPDYDDFSCVFKFGVSPSASELELGKIDPNESELLTSCFAQCQTKKSEAIKKDICQYLAE